MSTENSGKGKGSFVKLATLLEKASSSKPALLDTSEMSAVEFVHGFFMKSVVPAITSMRGPDIDIVLNSMDRVLGLRQSHAKTPDSNYALTYYADYYAGMLKDYNFMAEIFSGCGALISSFLLIAQDLVIPASIDPKVHSVSLHKKIVAGPLLNDAVMFAALIVGALSIKRFSILHENFVRDYIQSGYCPIYEPIVVTLTAVLVVYHYMLHGYINRKSFRDKIGVDLVEANAEEIFALLPKVFKLADK